MSEVPSAGQRAIKMLNGFDKSVWAACTTFGAKPQINRPGWEITEMWDNMYQAVAISSKYRFCGQGKTPVAALDDARKQMVEFRDELNIHIATH